MLSLLFLIFPLYLSITSICIFLPRERDPYFQCFLSLPVLFNRLSYFGSYYYLPPFHCSPTGNTSVSPLILLI